MLLITEGNGCNQINRSVLMSVSVCLEEYSILLAYLFSVIELLWANVHFSGINKFINI